MPQLALPNIPPLAPFRGTERVLAVDDFAEIRTVMGEQMKSLGYCVTLAASGDEALTILEEGAERFDILLSDIMMPGKLDGLDLARIVRMRWPELRVLLMSGFNGSATLKDGASAFPFLRKPFRKMELAQSLRLALAGDAAGS